mmetsp:Transcript_58109/g.133452  ORF Transcript_58109/g.133452 Transcript_58109/m.133452 type:complete len:206 (+) Transcript_58109:57-674(+)
MLTCTKSATASSIPLMRHLVLHRPQCEFLCRSSTPVHNSRHGLATYFTRKLRERRSGKGAGFRVGDGALPLTQREARALQHSFLRLLASHTRGLHVDQLWPLYRKMYGGRGFAGPQISVGDAVVLKVEKPDRSLAQFFRKRKVTLRQFLQEIPGVKCETVNERCLVHLSDIARAEEEKKVGQPFVWPDGAQPKGKSSRKNDARLG